jgi:exodeoxyribonuclease V alpha subunit
MSTVYDRLGMQGASAGTLGSTEHLNAKFQGKLREIETGAELLNLSADSVHLAAEIAAFEPGLSGEERVWLILLIVVSLAALEEGSTRFPVTGPQSVVPMRRLLGPLCGESSGADGIEGARSGVERILGACAAGGIVGTSPNDYKPLIYLPPFIYQHRILSAEIALARRLATLVTTPAVAIAKVAVRDLLLKLTSHSIPLGATSIDLSDEQRAAIECAISAPVTIISGGPGTGKTSIILAILTVLAGVGVDPDQIALAAPTGRAAYRIGESIRQNLPIDAPAPRIASVEPTTVHRLLGYSPTARRFRHHRNDPLTAKVVIVDEGSMLDQELMARLLDALRPDARLVILGDADQLPSVSAGAVFRDLLPRAGDGISALARNCVRLTRSYRVEREEKGGGALLKLASAIKAGDSSLFAGAHNDTIVRRHNSHEIEFAGAEWLDEETVGGAFLERWYTCHVRGSSEGRDLKNRIFTEREGGFASDERESLRRVFEEVAASRILCVTRVLDTGSERLSALLHRRVAHEIGVSPDRDRFMPGEPVMVLRNDYRRMLFNGDQGMVLRVRRPGFEVTRMAVFPRGDNFVVVPIDALKNHLELCYAMTVHKAQGSEFDSVAVLLPPKDIPILTREILYTAVSRARKSVTMVGSKHVISSGISRGIERYSGLREQLAKCLSESQ